MDNLRLTLLVLGALLIGGIYLFEVRRRRRAEESRRLREATRDMQDERGDGDAPTDTDVLFQGLERFTTDEGGDPDMGDLASMVAEGADGPDEAGRAGVADAPEEGGEDVPDETPVAEKPVARAAEPPEVPSGPELIVGLTVMARGTERFEGVRLGQALEAVGMEPGDMKIYHCAGTADRPSRHPVFSAASVLEPGTLDPADFEDFSTTGIVLFMRVGGRTDGSVAFELMLNTGQRLARELGGELCDETRSSLTNQVINHIRERISDHARRRLIGSV